MNIKNFLKNHIEYLYVITGILVIAAQIYAMVAIAEAHALRSWPTQQNELTQQVSQIINFDAVWYNPYRHFYSAYWMVWRWACYAALILCAVAYILRKKYKLFTILAFLWSFITIGSSWAWGSHGYTPISNTQAVFFGKDRIVVIDTNGESATYNCDSIIYEDYLWAESGSRYASKNGSDYVYIFLLRGDKTDKELARIYFDVKVGGSSGFYMKDFSDGNKEPSLSTLPKYAVESDFDAVTRRIYKMPRLYNGPTKRILETDYYNGKTDLRSLRVVWPPNEE